METMVEVCFIQALPRTGLLASCSFSYFSMLFKYKVSVFTPVQSIIMSPSAFSIYLFLFTCLVQVTDTKHTDAADCLVRTLRPAHTTVGSARRKARSGRHVRWFGNHCSNVIPMRQSVLILRRLSNTCKVPRSKYIINLCKMRACQTTVNKELPPNHIKPSQHFKSLQKMCTISFT